MFEDLLYDILIFYHANNFHLILAFWICEGIYLIYLLDQTSPISTEFPGWTVRFKNGGNDVIFVLNLSFSTADITVVAVISDHLLALIRHMRAAVFAELRRARHGSQPFQGVECFLFLTFHNVGVIGAGAAPVWDVGASQLKLNTLNLAPTSVCAGVYNIATVGVEVINPAVAHDGANDVNTMKAISGKGRIVTLGDDSKVD